ncbi:MAG: DUF5103 domain-containing protein [Hyphomicrobiales bacterium]
MKGKNKFTIRHVSLFMLLIACLSFNNSFAIEMPEGIQLDKNKIFDETIKTVLLYKTGNQLSPPIISLNSGAKLTLSFDDLEPNVKTFRYSFFHCDHNWKLSDLNHYEYSDGFEELEFSNYQYSRNTSYDYVHYETIIPSSDMNITKSGNYIVVVYEETLEKENIAFVWQFFVVDPIVTVGGKVKQSRLSTYRYSMQDIEFYINTLGNNIINPESSIYVKVQQNDRTDNIIEGVPPRSYINNVLSYDYDDKFLFQGGNEYRMLNNRSFRSYSEHQRKIEFDQNTGYHVFLFSDINRSKRPYLNDEDLNGKKAIETEKGYDPNTEGDYGWVHFFIPHPVPLPATDVYIIGGINDWNLDDKSRMTYNYRRKGYTDSLFVKQGYYSYVYGIVNHERKPVKTDLSLFEGNHFQTKNDYKIYIYYRQPGTIYDQLIGLEAIQAY